jgi:hypothetical protein
MASLLHEPEVREIAQTTLTIFAASQALHPVLLKKPAEALWIGIFDGGKAARPVLHYKNRNSLHHRAGRWRAGVSYRASAEQRQQTFRRDTSVGTADVRARGVAGGSEDHGGHFASETNGELAGGHAERAELIDGNIEYLQSDGRGTLVRMTAPREKVESHGG